MAAESTIISRPAFTWEELQHVSKLYGSYTWVKNLPSERDLNFLLQRCDENGEPDDVAGAGDLPRQVVLKVHNASDEREFVECQNQALELAAERGASCQKLLRTSEGDALVPLEAPAADGDSVCWCRALSFIPGRMLADVAAAASSAGSGEYAELMAAVGTAIGGLTAALLDFEHPSATRDFVWDLRICEEVISKHSSCLDDEQQEVIAGFLGYYRDTLVPLLPQLRLSIVHNDPNDYNLVVEDDGRVSILDFGDMLRSYTLSDAAICMAYLLFHCPADVSLPESVLPFARNFHARCPLEEAEASALFGLAVMRVCTSVCMSAYQSSLEPDNEYLLISAKPAWALLWRLAAEQPGETLHEASAAMREACVS